MHYILVVADTVFVYTLLNGEITLHSRYPSQDSTRTQYSQYRHIDIIIFQR